MESVTRFILSVCLTILLPGVVWAQQDEATYNASFCTTGLGGKAEVRYEYTYPAGTSYIRVDCETRDVVIRAALTDALASTASSKHSLPPISPARNQR